MPDISYHAEQAVLGALLADPARASDAAELTALDFAERRHQVIFTALTSGSEPGRGLFGRLRDWLARLPLRSQLRDLDQYMAELPARCPDPASLSAYAQMVTEASRERDAQAQARAAQQADPISHLENTAAWLAEQSRKAAEQASRLRRNGPADSTADSDLPRDVEQLARALAGRTNRAALAPAPAGGAQPAGASASPGRQVRAVPDAEPAPAPAPVGTTVTHRQPQQPMRAEDMQDLILADLLRRPGSVKDIIAWLPPGVFTPGPHQQLYTLIRDHAQDGRPIDPLIIAWEARKMAIPDEGGGSSPSAGQIDPQDVLRIGAMDVAPGTAALLGRALLADHLWTQRYGADWPMPARAAASAGSVPDVTDDPESMPAPVPAAPDVQAEPGPQAAPGPAEQPVAAAAAVPDPRQNANGAAVAPAAAMNAVLLDLPLVGPDAHSPAPRP